MGAGLVWGSGGASKGLRGVNRGRGSDRKRKIRPRVGRAAGVPNAWKHQKEYLLEDSIYTQFQKMQTVLTVAAQAGTWGSGERLPRATGLLATSIPVMAAQACTYVKTLQKCKVKHREDSR